MPFHITEMSKIKLHNTSTIITSQMERINQNAYCYDIYNIHNSPYDVSSPKINLILNLCMEI